MFKILVSSYTNDIYTLVFDPNSSSLTQLSSVTAGFHPSWITPHPDDRSLIFTGLEQSQGTVVAVKYDEAGHGTVVAEAPSGGAAPCTLLATKDELFIGNYSSGGVATFPISSEPPYFLAPKPFVVQLTGTGPNIERQEASHPHQVILHPERPELLVPDLGSDKVWRFVKGDSGTWKPLGHVDYSPGVGPRHIAIYDGVLYTALELTSQISSHRFPSLPYSPSLLSTLPTLSNPPSHPHDMLVAEIIIPQPNASFPHPLIYVSNRNDPSPDGDTIAIFEILSPDRIEPVGEVRTGLKHVRGIAFGGPDDRWLIAGGAVNGGVSVFERIEGGVNLRLVVNNSWIEAPTGFLWL